MTQKQEDVIIYSVTEGLSSEHTKKSYMKNFSHFLRCERIDEYTLIEQANSNPRLVESMIIHHIRQLAENQNLSHGSIKTHCFSIFHFFEMNDISLNTRKICRFLPPDEGSREDRAYTHQEISEIIDQCDERSKVAVFLMASTGMRIGAIRVLQLRDLAQVDRYELYKITVYANSPKERYYTFCTPECKLAIDFYLEYRHRFGEVLKPEAPLLRDQFDIRDPFQIQSPKCLSEDSCFWIIKQVLKRSGKKTSEVMQTHGFRKFAISTMIKAKVDYNTREYLVGHKMSRGLDVNYDRTSEEDRLAEYLKAVDLLTINSDNRLRRKIYELENERSAEWTALKTEMHELRKIVESVTHGDNRLIEDKRE